ncbi:Urease accessory protein UreD [Sporomusa ovata DSM 2662]|uniref:Urease accessory protein UreD n=1 Tax=Sporomusa ovata TaxID=2378 RepID=A0A0U1KUE7_9FIRM|nr:urease accessory protein UreD [Sporomusa ovata]EQB26219.1 urease accessory protein UreD [Sporomusa ovata DSM 2662]CQR70294.1 Urease accessory protein UreD [Sporomusa ovata]
MLAKIKQGIIQAEVAAINGRSVLSSVRQRMPLRVSSPLYPVSEQTVNFFIMNPAAGLLQGDQHSIYVHVKENAQAVIMGQGATKVFRSPKRNFSKQFTTICVEAGARLEYMPEVIIPFAESCLLSRTNILVSSQASVLFWEINAPGRLARQERFAYSKLDQQTNIYIDRELIFSDRFVLEPAIVPTELQSWNNPLGLVHGYTHTGTFWVINPNAEQELGYVLQRNMEAEEGYLEKIANKYGVLLAGTKLTKAAYCFRALGHNADNIQEAFKELWQIFRQRLFNQTAWPWRKY